MQHNPHYVVQQTAKSAHSQTVSASNRKKCITNQVFSFSLLEKAYLCCMKSTMILSITLSALNILQYRWIYDIYYYDVYFQINHEDKKMTILLGDKKKTIDLRKAAGYVWKYKDGTIYCQSSEWLEKSLLDPFLHRHAVSLLRRVLKIKKTVWPEEVWGKKKAAEDRRTSILSSFYIC